MKNGHRINTKMLLNLQSMDIEQLIIHALLSLKENSEN